MYLQYYAIAFLFFAVVDMNNIRVWLLLACCCFMLKANIAIFDANDDTRYILRTLFIFMFSGLILKERRLFALYHSVVLLLFLVANFLMLRGISNLNFFYANYEAIIYGLVCAQFAGILPRIWCYINNSFTNYISSNKNSKLGSRV
jgi:hypothetical protein